MSHQIEVQLNSRRGDFTLDAHFTLPGEGVSALFGHSGSGKTTILRCIAGLEPGVKGVITVDGQHWQFHGSLFIPPHQRPIGYVFQEANLFSHLDVQANIEFAQRRIKPSQQRMKCDDVVEMLGIGHLLKRSVTHLSGGERQRVAIARALLTNPRLLLMDEPLASLDERSKGEILPYLERLNSELMIPMIYVSHSQKELSRLADHMVWLEQGKVQAQGTLQQVLGRFDLAATHGEDAGEVIITQVAEHQQHYHLTRLQCAWGGLWVKQLSRELGAELRVHIPAKDVSLTLGEASDSSIQNIWPVVVEDIAEAQQGQVMVRLKSHDSSEDATLLSRITLRSLESLQLQPGKHCFAQIKSVGLLE